MRVETRVFDFLRTCRNYEFPDPSHYHLLLLVNLADVETSQLQDTITVASGFAACRFLIIHLHNQWGNGNLIFIFFFSSTQYIIRKP